MYQYKLLLSIVAFCSCGAPAPPPAPAISDENILYASGQVLFRKLCSNCHGLPEQTDFNMDVAAAQSAVYFKAYVCCQDSLLRHKDPLAVELKRKWNNEPYRHQFQLTNAELDAVLLYIKKN